MPNDPNPTHMERNSPYVYRAEPDSDGDEPRPDDDEDARDEEVVVVDGEAMTYREYREGLRTE